MGAMRKDSDEVLFAELYPGLRSFAAVVGDDDMEPEDIVQDVLVSTLRTTSLSELTNRGAYLRRSVVHRVTSNRRSLATRRSLRPVIDADASHSTSDSYPVELNDLLPKDPIDRAVLWLSAIEGLASHEIAEAVGLSPAAVRKRLSRLRSNNRNGEEKGADS